MTRARVPAHITGFFAAKMAEDPFQTGSIGCGFTLDLEAVTTVEPAIESSIFLNGAPSPAPVSRYVLDRMAQGPVKVSTELYMPLGSGFGASGAGALGCAYALNHHFNLGLTAGKAASIAHAAEVANGTGLGDVIAQNTGGLVIRIKPGAPGIGQVDRIPVPPTRVDCVVRGPISTKEVLSDPSAMRAVNQAGEACVKEIISRPTLEEFMRLSKRFTKQCNLASPWVLDVVEAVEAAGGQAAMIMLGEAVFALDVGQALREFGPVISASITQQGARLD